MQSCSAGSERNPGPEKFEFTDVYFFFFFQWKIKSIKINDNNNNFFFSLPVIQKKSLVLISMKNTDRNCTDMDYSPGASMWP